MVSVPPPKDETSDPRSGKGEPDDDDEDDDTDGVRRKREAGTVGPEATKDDPEAEMFDHQTYLNQVSYDLRINIKQRIVIYKINCPSCI